MAERYTVTALTPMRKVIAARMAEAKLTIPHYRLNADLEIDALVEVRREFRERFPSTPVSIIDLLVKSCATASMDTPAINIQWAKLRSISTGAPTCR
jgi:pyruvate dehydrogenase E2 component (dihydrolipoamide acetyltransferase)